MPVLCIHEILTFSHVAQLWQLSIPCNGTGRDLEVLISCTILNDMLVSAILLVSLLAPASFEGKNN